MDYESLFAKVGAAQPLNNWKPNLPHGRHTVALVKYVTKVSQLDRTRFLEAEFVILGEPRRYSWPWFVNKPDQFGYTHARARNFLEVVQRCIGDEQDTGEFGVQLVADFEAARPKAFGLTLNVDVTKVLGNDGAPARGRKGNEVFNATWSPIAQNASAITAAAEVLNRMGVYAQGDASVSSAPTTSEAGETIFPRVMKKSAGLLALVGKPQ